MKEFDYSLKISVSDKHVKTTIGPEAFEKLFDAELHKTDGRCAGCGYRPLDENKIKSVISFHVIDFNPEAPTEITGVPLCKACHATQHFDVAVNNDWVEVVNSTISQKGLIELCRINAIHNNVNIDNTRKLKATPKEFLEKMKLGSIFPSSKAKIILTSKFEWGEL